MIFAANVNRASEFFTSYIVFARMVFLPGHGIIVGRVSPFLLQAAWPASADGRIGLCI